jgi:ANTAR domain-containing protein
MQQRHPAFEGQYAIVQSIDGDGKTRSRQGPRAVDGGVTGADGYDIDVTASEREHQNEVTAAVTAITEHRADIEQAKGMLMLIHGMADPQAAFDLLRWRSQETNTKLRLLARQIVADFVALSGRETLPPQSAYDNLFLTAHLRVDPDAESEEDTR